MAAILSTLITFGLAIAASTQPAAPIPTSGLTQSQQFTLVAKVVNSELGLDVQNWVVGGTRIGAGQMAATLIKARPLDTAAGRMYQNGTTKDTSCGIVGTNNVVAAGTGQVPFEFQINEQPAPSQNSACGISVGSGTQGVGIVKDDHGVPYFMGNGQLDGQFYSCNLTLWGPGAVQALYWRSADAAAPSGCADVKLVPQCAGNLDNSTLYTQELVPAPCLENAVAIDATPVRSNPNGDGQLQIPLGAQE